MTGDAPLCPFCGAYSARQCELEDETGGECPWELSRDDEPDPDILRDDRGERRRVEREDHTNGGAGRYQRSVSSIGELEQLAGVTDRSAFWAPFAKFEDGLDRGVAELRRLIAEAAHGR